MILYIMRYGAVITTQHGAKLYGATSIQILGDKHMKNYHRQNKQEGTQTPNNVNTKAPEGQLGKNPQSGLKAAQSKQLRYTLIKFRLA